MERAIIFGASDSGKLIYNSIKDTCEILYFVDQDSSKWGSEIFGYMVKNPEEIKNTVFDTVYIGVLTYYEEILDLLLNMGISRKSIDGTFIESQLFPRIECLKNVKTIFDIENITEGNVAELGVFRGDFAKEINRLWPDKKLYLFDTFEGFPLDDAKVEYSKGYSKTNRNGYFSNTTEELVLAKMQNPEKCIVKKGYFPETALNIEDKFCFVNLDADLYAPTLAGLEFFYPRLVSGGVILVHDFFSKAFSGAREAVVEFTRKENLRAIPIGDTLSVAIRKE